MTRRARRTEIWVLLPLHPTFAYLRRADSRWLAQPLSR